MKKLYRNITISILFLWFSLPVCAQQPLYGGTLYVGMLTDAWSLDPIHIQTTTGIRVYLDAGIGETLYRWSVEDEEYLPWLALELPEISADGLTYRIPLRRGVKFHDGTLFDAHAMVYSIQRILNPENKSYVYHKYADVIDEVEALDDYTLQIRLKTRDHVFLAKLAGPEVSPVSRQAVEQAGQEYGITTAVGTGPFHFVEWTPGDRIVLKRFEDYWQAGVPYLEKVVFKIIPEEAAALVQLRLEEIHILEDVPRKDIHNLITEASNLTVQLLLGIQHEQIYLNNAHPPFNDLRVRQAMAYALDRQMIIDVVFDGHALESVGPYHSWSWIHNPDWSQPYPYNPEKAEKLLAEAGYGPQNPLTFELMATNQDMFVDQAIIIQEQLKQIGVQVDVLPLDKNVLFDRVYVRNAYQGQLEMFAAALEDWGASVDDPENSAERVFASNSGANKGFYKNPEVDRLFQTIKAAKTLDEQKAFYYQTEALIARDSPTIWICNPKDAVAYSNKVQGFHPDARYRLPLATVWLEEGRE